MSIIHTCIRKLLQVLRHAKHVRTSFLAVGVLFAVLVSLWSDPDGGLSTALAGVGLLQGLVAVALVHVIRKVLTPYDEADWRALFARASEGPSGAGLALVAQAIVLYALMSLFGPRAHAGEAQPLPAGYLRYGSVLWQEQHYYWPDHPRPALLASLVEQESCPSLTSKQCWNPAARLKTQREEGAGMGELTRAYDAHGALRFDALSEMRNRYPTELGALPWDSIYQRPNLQFRALILMNGDFAKPFCSLELDTMLAFTDTAHNGGLMGLQREWRAGELRIGCNLGQGFGHIKLHCWKTWWPLYGLRSACDINFEKVYEVMQEQGMKF